MLAKIYCQDEDLEIDVDWREKDKILACSEISSLKFSRDSVNGSIKIETY
jgi:hypothetical protein